MSVSKLSEQMVKAGCTVEVFTTTANGAGELSVTPGVPTDVDGVRVTYFKRITKDHSHFSPALLRKMWKEARSFDVVHVHAWWNLVSVFSCLIALMRGVPVVVSPRGTLSGYSFTNKNSLPKKIIHHLLGKRLLKRSNLHVTSGREEIAMEAIVHSRSISNIPNFIALPDDVPLPPEKGEGCLKLIFFSRIEEKKGLDILLDALPSVTIPYHLTIAGDGDAGYVDKLKAMAVQNGISRNVSWIGFQGKNKFDVLQQHHLMVLPSYDENFGNVVIESLSTGTAVLISEHVGLADYVAASHLGWVCGLDAADIGRHIDLAGQQPEKLSAIRKQAPLKIRNDFNEELLTGKYMDMYHQIINHG